MTERGRFFAQIRGGIYHCTTWAGFKGIVRTAAIVPNHGQLGSPYASFTKKSYGFNIRAICVFDLVEVGDNELSDPHSRWHEFFDRLPVTVVLRLAADGAVSKRVRNIEGMDAWRANPCVMVIPEVEAWVVEQVPLSQIEGCYVVPAGDIGNSRWYANDAWNLATMARWWRDHYKQRWCNPPFSDRLSKASRNHEREMRRRRTSKDNK